MLDPATYLTTVPEGDLQTIAYDALCELARRNPPTQPTLTVHDQVTKTIKELVHISEIQQGHVSTRPEQPDGFHNVQLDPDDEARTPQERNGLTPRR